MFSFKSLFGRRSTPARSRSRSAKASVSNSPPSNSQQQEQMQTSLKGPSGSVGGSLLSVQSDATATGGAGFSVGNGTANAGLDSNKGLFGDVEVSAFEGDARYGTNQDVAQASLGGKISYAGAEGQFGRKGMKAGAEIGLGTVEAKGRLGPQGAHTASDLSLTGGLALGAGARASAGINWGQDIDGDGIPNYGFSLGGMFGLGANVGLNVEQPGQQALSAFDRVFGTSFSSLQPDPTPTMMGGKQVGGLLGSGLTTAQEAAAPYGHDRDGGEFGGLSGTTSVEAATDYGGDIGGEFAGLSPSTTTSTARRGTRTRSTPATTSSRAATASRGNHSSRGSRGRSADHQSMQDEQGFDHSSGSQDAANTYAGGDLGGEFGSTPSATTSSKSSSRDSGGSDSGSGGGGGCFLTTAACGHRGLPDDCHALTVLRGFRDSHMMATRAGREKVEEYYRIAPRIVEAVEASSDPRGVWQSLWDGYIVPSVEAVERREVELADALYSAMVEQLREAWLLD